MKYGMADELLPATSEGGRAVKAFIKICPPADRANLDREWIEMCGLFVKGWLAKAAEQNAHLTGGGLCVECGLPEKSHPSSKPFCLTFHHHPQVA